MKIKVIALALAILAFFIFVGSPFQQAAAAVALVDDAIIAILIAALAAIGITFISSGSFGDTNQFVRSELESFAASQGKSINQLFDGVNVGSSKLSQLLVNNRFVRLLNAFAVWLQAKYALHDNDVFQIRAKGNAINGMVAYVPPVAVMYADYTGGRELVIVTSEEPCYVLLGYDGGGLSWYVVSLEPATYRIDRLDRDGNVTNIGGGISLTQHTHVYYRSTYTGGTYDLSGYVTYTSQEIVDGLEEQFNHASSNESISIVTGTMALPEDDPAYPDNPGAVIDLGVPWGLSYGDIVTLEIPTAYEDGGIAYESEQEVTEQVEDTPAQSVSENPSEYSINGLVNVFPFCIPFDIYSFFECLAAAPVAPSFEWRFYVPGICDETIELDLAQFDTVAQIVRTMELLAFIVGLAFVTRDKMIKG